MSTTKSSCYIRFLNLIDVLDRINPGKKLDSIEESLLDKIILSFHAKQSILVGDLISLSDLGSQATLHGRLKNLSAMKKFPSVLQRLLKKANSSPRI